MKKKKNPYAKALKRFTQKIVPDKTKYDRKKTKNKRMSFQTEIVKGECPTCNQITTLVGITSQFYRCMECGGDLEQHVNGKISYLPIMTKRADGGVPFVKEWK